MARKRGPARTPDELIELAAQQVERGELAEAEANYRAALAAEPRHLGALTLLGLLRVDRGDPDGAIDLLERGRALAPDFAPLQLALGSAYAAAGHDGLAVTAMETAVKLDTMSTVPLERLARHHILAHRSREAIGALRRILRRDPEHVQAKFLLTGLTNESTTSVLVESPPPELIADLFDSYAPTFEKHLVEELHYSVPKALADLIRAVTTPAQWRVLDLGCGTGLVGAELRAESRELVGVDLSPRMISRTRQRGLYDQLYCEDQLATLARLRDFDLIVAADVFIYVGTLTATFAACADALRPGGLLAFSVETSADDDVRLQTTLRYAHSDEYIRTRADKHGFVIERAEPTTLRVDDKGQPVAGMLYVLAKPS